MFWKIIFMIMVLLFSAAGMTAEKKTAVSSPAKGKTQYTNPGKVAQLMAQKQELQLKKQRRRIDLLKNDPKLKQMHQQLLQQAAVLAKELESRNEIIEINESINKIDSQIKSYVK